MDITLKELLSNPRFRKPGSLSLTDEAYEAYVLTSENHPEKHVPDDELAATKVIWPKAGIDRAMQLRLELFDIANSYAGDKTGHAAVMLHEACNFILRAEQALKEAE